MAFLRWFFSKTTNLTEDVMSYAQKVIHEMDQKINPAGVEGSMRLHYGTLNHLDRLDFQLEIKVARACEEESPGFLRSCAGSLGLDVDFVEWEKRNSEYQGWGITPGS